MKTMQEIICRHEGAVLVGQVATPDGVGTFPAVLVMHNAHGLGGQVLSTARKLADHGYLAIATDMYGGGAYYPDPSQAGDDFTALMKSPNLLRARTIAWFDTVAALPDSDPARIAAIGYCFGGNCVLELARSGTDVKAVVSYHGLLTTHSPAQPGVIKGEVSAYCGGKDPYAPLDHIEGLRKELAETGASYQIMTFSNAEHSFTDPDAAKMGRPGIAYNAIADRVSWAGTLALLDNVFNG